ncbi:hypothetical protein A7K91_24745 [Paenibacillus oryzae]|uniref:Uncharacterized protein n=1 Tax=Paenibacillus oryzae TaxID=1844972 RepID=A0A1A5YM19_9BACL|nr:hypothetical protein [Paenibacillus oryzae]OBR66425.1 hypothetical protein A7K91_24745 [Paenibacillus oryzae]
MRKTADWLVHLFVFLSIYYLLFYGAKLFLQDWYISLAFTNVIQTVILVVLGIISFVATVKLVQLSRKKEY